MGDEKTKFFDEIFNNSLDCKYSKDTFRNGILKVIFNRSISWGI